MQKILYGNKIIKKLTSFLYWFNYKQYINKVMLPRNNGNENYQEAPYEKNKYNIINVVYTFIFIC